MVQYSLKGNFIHFMGEKIFDALSLAKKSQKY